MTGKKSDKKITGTLGSIATWVAVAMAVYHILYIAHIFQWFGVHILMEIHRAFHVVFVLALVYLLFPFKKGTVSGKFTWQRIALTVLAIALPLYFIINNDSLRWSIQGTTDLETVLGLIGIIMVLEAARRAVDWPMPFIAAIFFLYALYGNYIPGFFHHRGFSLKSTIEAVVYSDLGIFGTVTGVAATIIIIFVLFGQFLIASGGGEFFVKVAYALMGKYRGGPAKVAIVASMLFGMISGSASANVATTGTFTIPLMKKIGYRPEFAGAVEAVASNGGQFTPPVLGTVAFIMAEWLGISYWNIVIASAIPAILYYIALYIYVDIEAMRIGLKGIPSEEIPSLKSVFKVGWIYVFPLAFLMYLIGWLNYPVQNAALYTIAVLVIISAFRKETRLTLKKLVGAFRGGTVGGLQAYVACITAGIIVSSIMITGLGPKITSVIVTISHGNLFLISLLAAVTCFVLGMGMGTVPIYLILVTLVAPAMIQVGVPPLAAHFFVFWWGLTAHITPPVAVPVFIASSIANGQVSKTGYLACRLGSLTYILPFVWVFHPALMLIGPLSETVIAIVMTLAAVIILGFGLSGFMLNWWQRTLLVASAFLTLTLNWYLITIGIVISISILLWHRLVRQRLGLTAKSNTG